MDKKLAGLVGVLGVLAVATPGHAASNLATAMQANTYADLLRPIPNATELLARSDAASAPEAELLQAQYRREYDHHHHHHHRFERRQYRAERRYERRGYYHHHHHHQQRGIGVFIR